MKWPGNSKEQEASTNPQQSGQTDKTDAAYALAPSDSPKKADAAADEKDHQADLASDSEKKRARACTNIKDPTLLLSVALNDKAENVRSVAARQYARVLPAGESSRQTLKEFASTAEKRHIARLMTAHNNDAAFRKFGIDLFNADEDLFHIAAETRFHDTRHTVSSSIKSHEFVDKCYRAIKSKDTKVAKELKLRITEQQAASQLLIQQEEEVDKVIDEMSKLAHGAWSPTLPNRYELFHNRWQAIDFPIADDKREQFNALNAVAAEKVASHAAQQQAHDDRELILTELDNTLSRVRSVELAELTGTIAHVEESAPALHSRWRELPAESGNDKKAEQRYEQLSRTLQRLTGQANVTLKASQDINNKSLPDVKTLSKHLEKLQQLKTQQSADAKPPAFARELPAIMEAMQQAITTGKQQTRELKASINKQFGSLNSAISANRWGPAKSIHERLAKKISRLANSDKAHFQEKLERLEKKLHDLGDWKQFATEPKLEALCEQMEQVPALGLAPKDQADRIKDLQQQWKAMGASPGQEKHWPRFKQAADIAFEPCARFFEARRNEKKAKLGQRAEICDMLQGYLDKTDWQNADTRLVEKTVRAAKNEWRNTRVFDRKAGTELEARFTKILSGIDEKLQPTYDASAAEKSDLIAKVTALGEGDINQHCINQVKRLQSMWRRTGVTRRKDDQKLWTQFNDICSTIYQSHRGQQREQYAASMEHVTRARQIIAELKNISKNDSALDEKQLSQLQEEFNALAEFPEKEQKYLRRDFARALDSVENHRVKVQQAANEDELHRLSQNADICSKLEELAGQSSEAIQSTVDSLVADWNDGEKSDNSRWKKAMQLRRDTILTHLAAGTLPDFASNTKARRLHCIETEIFNDRETPESDKQLRMQYQLEKLQNGLNSATATSAPPAHQLMELKIRWLTMLPAEQSSRESLNQRFNSALGK